MSGWTIDTDAWNERLRTDGEVALGELFDELRARLRNTLGYRMDPRLRGRVDPSDVIQDAFVEAARRLTDYVGEPDMPPHLWVRFLTVQQLLISHRRHLGTQARDAGREVGLREQAGVSSECIVFQLMDVCPSPSSEAQEAERAAKLLEALEGMDPIDREVLTLRHFEQLSNAEAAEVLDIKPGTASVRYFRALERLRDLLADTNL